jgi:hypothetical protein
MHWRKIAFEDVHALVLATSPTHDKKAWAPKSTGAWMPAKGGKLAATYQMTELNPTRTKVGDS